MLLYYHSTFDFVYALLLIPSGVYKMMVGDRDPWIIIGFVLTLFYVLTEYFRINFGYTGNINESFPELIAFLI